MQCSEPLTMFELGGKGRVSTMLEEVLDNGKEEVEKITSIVW